jgi:hypothetical protein
LELLLPIREQVEIMYVRCVLKPVITRMAKLNEKPGDAEEGQNEEQKKESNDVLSDHEEIE